MSRPQDTVERGGNLVPFVRGGPNPGHLGGRGRPSPLNDPEWVDVFAHALAEGLTIKELAAEFNIGERTVKTYKKDQRVKNAALRHVEDRIIRITRRTDSKLDALLVSKEFNELAIDERILLLLKVRKETLGGVLRMQAETGKADAGTINDTMDALENDPEAAREFAALAERLAAGKE